MSDKQPLSDGNKTSVTEAPKRERIGFIIGKGVSLEEAGAFIDELHRKHFGDKEWPG